jgi:hypothetical protein
VRVETSVSAVSNSIQLALAQQSFEIPAIYKCRSACFSCPDCLCASSPWSLYCPVHLKLATHPFRAPRAGCHSPKNPTEQLCACCCPANLSCTPVLHTRCVHLSCNPQDGLVKCRVLRGA